MTPRNKTLKPKQISAIKLLATGAPLVRVAERLEITCMTLHRWKKLPEFERTLNSVSYSGMEELTKKMNAAALTAAETIQEILCNLQEPTPLRLKAALGALRAMPAVNTALERGMQHQTADFDLRDRFSGPTFTLNGDGQRCQVQGISGPSEVVVV